MQELIARLKRATGADWKLDQEIFAFKYGWSYPLVGAALEEFDGLDRENKNYTESTHAAITLVPEGYWWCAGDCKREAHASVGKDYGDDERDEDTVSEGYGETAAIAICIAVIKAIAALNQSDRGETQ